MTSRAHRGPDLPAVGRVPAVGLEERHEIIDEIREAARVVQELADRDALGERRGVSVQVEHPFGHELRTSAADEDLRHASDAEAMLDGERLARRDVSDAGRCLNSTLRPEGHHRRPRNTGCDDRLELILNRCHG